MAEDARAFREDWSRALWGAAHVALYGDDFPTTRERVPEALAMAEAVRDRSHNRIHHGEIQHESIVMSERIYERVTRNLIAELRLCQARNSRIVRAEVKRGASS